MIAIPHAARFENLSLLTPRPGRWQMVRVLRYTLFHETRQFRAASGRKRDEETSTKKALCRGPESNWRHVVLQVMFPAIREIVPELKRDDTWLRPTENGSTRRTASRLFRSSL